MPYGSQERCLGLTVGSTCLLSMSDGVDSCTLGRVAPLAIDQLNAKCDGDSKGKCGFIAVQLPHCVHQDEAGAPASIGFI